MEKKNVIVKGNNFIAYYNSAINKYILKIRINGKNTFICINESKFKKTFSQEKIDYIDNKPKKWEFLFLFMEIIPIGIMLFISLIYQINDAYDFNLLGGIFSVLWLLINIVLHELAHIAMLNYFGGTSDGVKFKLIMYIFPAFYVNTSDSYLMNRRQRILIYLAGLGINSILNLLLLIYIFFSGGTFLIPAYKIVSSTIIFNLIPLMNTDGYNVLLAFINEYPFKKKNKNHLIMKIFQLISNLARLILVGSIIKSILF